MKKGKFRKKYGRYWGYYLFLLIPLVYVLIFNYYPMLGLQIAFKKYKISKSMWETPWAGFYQFKKFFNSYEFGRLIKNTLGLSVYSVLAAFPFPILFALTLNCIQRDKMKKVVQTITYLPHFISIVVVVSILQQMLNPLSGVFGTAWKAITGTRAPDLFGSEKAFPHLYVWSGVWQNFGYNSIIYFAALSSVDTQLHEAAQVDGASRFQRVIHIDLPAILPTISIMLILRMGSVMNLGFQKIYLMQNNLNIASSEVISTFVYKRGLASGSGNDYSYSTAVDMFNSVINLILVMSTNALSKKLSGDSLW